MKRFSFVGAGNLGVPFIRALRMAGFRLRYVYRKAKDDSLSPFYISSYDRLVDESDFVVISVQESKIRAVANEIAGAQHLAGKIVFHTANSLSSDELQPLRNKGAAVASFSPLQTFPPYNREPQNLFKGIQFLLEGDPPAAAAAKAIARKLAANVIEVKKEDKQYFHIAAIAASNFLVSLFVFIARQLDKTQAPKQAGFFFPLARQTLCNMERDGVFSSLSGPLVRGETKLIRRHLRTLKGLDRKYYRVLTDYLRIHYGNMTLPAKEFKANTNKSCQGG